MAEVAGAASADYIFHLDFLGAGGDSNMAELCSVTSLLLLFVFFASSPPFFSPRDPPCRRLFFPSSGLGIPFSVPNWLLAASSL